MFPGFAYCDLGLGVPRRKHHKDSIGHSPCPFLWLSGTLPFKEWTGKSTETPKAETDPNALDDDIRASLLLVLLMLQAVRRDTLVRRSRLAKLGGRLLEARSYGARVPCAARHASSTFLSKDVWNVVYV